MIRWLMSLALLLTAVPAAAQIPHLKDGQLIVDGKPYLILGGELGNSSASDRAWLAPRWARMKALHLNTVLAPVSWELVEPEEGKYDWSSVDWLIEDARANDMRLVLLWFGVWKNSMSTYVPSWVKRDQKRFPRALNAAGVPQEILSVFAPATRDADARAFAALMRHLREVDGKRHTVIMVQVENEVGFLPDAREHGPLADAAFAGHIPDEAMESLPARMVYWRERFGKSEAGEEAFTAWHYARFIDAVAAAGKREYALPMFVNGAQGRPGVKPGGYPSGGPLAHLWTLWKRGAPSIDFLAPDIYFPNFAGIVEGYVQPGNPLFVPEANNAGDPRAAANALLVIGRHRGIGFSPFSIDGIEGPGAERLGGLYAMLANMAPAILMAQAEGRIAGFAAPVSFEGEVDERVQHGDLGGARFNVTFIDPWTPRDKQQPSEHGGILIWLGGEDYLVAGSGVTLTVTTMDGKGRFGLDQVDEGRFIDGKWTPGRRLNGDQTHQGRHVRLPPGQFGIQKVRLYRY
jgi:beta-galactosidase GanA